MGETNATDHIQGEGGRHNKHRRGGIVLVTRRSISCFDTIIYFRALISAF